MQATLAPRVPLMQNKNLFDIEIGVLEHKSNILELNV